MNEVENRDFLIGVENIMHTAYLQYSLSVNVGRAIPDVRDGLKPVNRRILYAMKRAGFVKSRPYVKSAKVIGEVIGKYHPHGDSSVYDALTRLTQPFSMNVPLVDGQGNWGSIDGDSAAAYRYTECRLERISEEMLADIGKDTVDMTPNFDETEPEPSVLPAKFPQLLVNGATGIGVGMATSIPPHNLGEVIDATLVLLDNPNAELSELMEKLPGPDFPTAGIVRGLSGIRQFYQTGRGSIKVRAKAEIEEHDGRERIIVTEIPYMVNKEQMVKKIADLVNEKRITGISGLRDESSKRVGGTGVRIVIEVKRGAMASVVLNQLYTHTQMETSYGCIMLVVDRNRPRVMNLRGVLEAYIDHRLEVVTRRTVYDLKKAEARAHILDGFIIILDNIDEAVRVIRDSRSRGEAAAALRERFGLSLEQADAILDMRLYQLTGMAREAVETELAELRTQIDYFRRLLASRAMRLGVVRDELAEVRDAYATARRSEITADDSDLNIADLIPRHSCVITVSNTGYIKRVPADTYRTRHRGGVGIIGMETKNEDYVEHIFNADSHDVIFFITDRGFMYNLNVYEIPEGNRTGKGRAIGNMIRVENGEKIRAMLTVSPSDFDDPGKFVFMATRNGVVKKTALSAFKNLRKVGIRALIIDDDDDLIGAAVTEDGDEVVLSSLHGMACRFSQCDGEVRPMGRSAMGVTGMRFKIPGDCLVGMEIIRESVGEDVSETEEAESAHSGEPEILIVTSGGMGKRSRVATYRRTHRGATGVTSIRLREGETVVAAVQVTVGDELICTTERGQLVRLPVDEIRTVGRASYGVRIMNLRPGDTITGAVRVVNVGGDAAEDQDETAQDSGETDPGVTETDGTETDGTETDGVTETDTETSDHEADGR